MHVSSKVTRSLNVNVKRVQLLLLPEKNISVNATEGQFSDALDANEFYLLNNHLELFLDTWNAVE